MKDFQIEYDMGNPSNIVLFLDKHALITSGKVLVKKIVSLQTNNKLPFLQLGDCMELVITRGQMLYF